MYTCHPSFAEYTPIAILCLAAAELPGAHPILLFISVTLLVMGRLLHGYYFHKNNRVLKTRIRGMQCTFIAIWTAAASAFGYTLISLL